ncbi:MAG: type II toxin-antitoxin system HicA family toxin [Candidatus Korobacteraceae bacterium]|jgi:predicted RNA binding protein YcfA (HicA-like mRNA interferase family)
MIPRGLGGHELAKLLRRYGYQITRQKGSHLRLTTNLRGYEHHLTIPAHRQLKIGTLNTILVQVSAYLNVTRRELEQELFNQ